MRKLIFMCIDHLYYVSPTSQLVHSSGNRYFVGLVPLPPAPFFEFCLQRSSSKARLQQEAESRLERTNGVYIEVLFKS